MAEPATPSLADLIREQAAAIGDDIAFTFEGRDLTYRELDLVSNRVANALLAAGVGRGDRIAFLDKNTLELFELVFGAAKVGAVVCPVNWRLAPAEIAHIVNDADAKVVVVGSDFFGVLDACEPDLSSSPLILAVGGHPRHPELADWRDAHARRRPRLETSARRRRRPVLHVGHDGSPEGRDAHEHEPARARARSERDARDRRRRHREPRRHAAVPRRRRRVGALRPHGRRPQHHAPRRRLRRDPRGDPAVRRHAHACSSLPCSSSCS